MRYVPALAVVGLLAIGCIPEVIDGSAVQDTPDDGSGGSTAGSGGGSVVDFLPAVAMTRAQLDVLWDEYWDDNPSGSSSSSSGGSGDLDPDDLFIRISDLGVSCSSPTTELTCGGHWSLSVALPPAYQAVGVYSLTDPLISQYSLMTETGQLNSSAPDDCSWGGGSLGSGTIEIISISLEELTFAIDMDSFWSADPSGTYTAPLCP